MPPKSLEEQYSGWCKHYQSPTHNATCARGVNYRELADGDRPGMYNRLPCLRSHNKEDAVAECQLREWPTPEEIAESIAETRKAIINTIAAREAITNYLEATGQPHRNVAGSIGCPVCNVGWLHYSIAFNGHCHAKCSTIGCVSWME